MKILTDKKTLQEFAIIMAIALPLLFGLLFPWLFKHHFALWPWITAAFFLVVGFTIPVILKPIYILWMKFAHILGFVNSRIILTLVFFIVVFPIGVILRLVGHDPMQRKVKKDSYFIDKKTHLITPEDMEKPF